jgi:hypothetical protein
MGPLSQWAWGPIAMGMVKIELSLFMPTYLFLVSTNILPLVV